MDFAAFDRILLVLLTNDNDKSQQKKRFCGMERPCIPCLLGSTLVPALPTVGRVGSAGHAVVGVELRLDLADVSQQLVEHSLSVGPVAGVDATHPLGRVAVHLHRAVAMGTKGSGLLGLELFLPLQSILFNLCLSFFLGLFQTPVLTFAGFGHLLSRPLLGL